MYNNFETCSQNCEKRLLASSCLSVYRSVRIELSSHWKDFYEIWHLGSFLKSVEKF